MGTQWGAALISTWSWSWPHISAQTEPPRIHSKPKQLCLHLMSSSGWSGWRSVIGTYICWRLLQRLDWSPSSYLSSSWSLVSSFLPVCMCADGHPHTIWISSWPGFEAQLNQTLAGSRLPSSQTLTQITCNLDPMAAAFSRRLTRSTSAHSDCSLASLSWRSWTNTQGLCPVADTSISCLAPVALA